MICTLTRIKTMAEQGYNWIYYDREFRKDRAAMDNPYPWNAYREDLYLQAASVVFKNNNTQQMMNVANSVPVTQAKNVQSNVSARELVPKGYCYAFHSPNQRCSKNNECKYNHDCFKCRKSRHPAFRCKVSGSGKTKADKSKSSGEDNNNTN